jgi:hypothetical protein
VLAALEDAGFIESYVVDGQDFGRIPGFTNWQSFHPHEKPSSIPEPTNVGSEPTKVRRSNAALTTAPIAAPTSTLTPTMPPPKAAAKVERFADAFGVLWAAYPKRVGGNSRGKAYRAYAARRGAGVAHDAILEGLTRYARFIRATAKEGTQYVMQGATFFGPDEHYLEPWDVPSIVIAPPRPRSSENPSEEAERRHRAEVQLADRYNAEAHRVGAQWAKAHPELFGPIKEHVERSYRGIPELFAKDAIKAELTQRCAKEADFPAFDAWQKQTQAVSA